MKKALIYTGAFISGLALLILAILVIGLVTTPNSTTLPDPMSDDTVQMPPEDPDLPTTPDPVPPEATEYSTYTDSSFNIELQYPSNWINSDEEIIPGILQSFYPPQNAENPRSGGVGIAAQAVGENTGTVKEFTDFLLRLIGGFGIVLGYTGLEIMSQMDTTFDGSPALETVATVTHRGQELQMKAVSIVKDGIGYLIVYVADVALYDDLLDTAQEVIDSLTIQPPSSSSLTVSEASTTPDQPDPGLASVEATRPKTYEDPSFNIKLQYPSNWGSFDQEAIPGLLKMFGPPQNPLDSLSGGVGIVARPLGEGASTVEDFTDSLLNLIEAARYLGFVVEDFMMEDPKETTLDGSPALEIVANVKYMNWDLKMKAVTTVKDGIGYLIGYAADVAMYDELLGTAQQVIDSFTIGSN